VFVRENLFTLPVRKKRAMSGLENRLAVNGGETVCSQRHSAVSGYALRSRSDSRSSKTGVNPIDGASRGTVIIADKDNYSRRDLRVALAEIGFDVGEASTKDEIARRLRMIEYDAVLLNMNLGIETIRFIRADHSRMPVFAYAKAANDSVQLKAFDAGADDFIVMPFKLSLLDARVRSSIRRYHATEVPVDRTLTVGDVILDPIRRKVERKGAVLHLRPQEFRLLHFLMENAGKSLTHEAIFKALWEEEQCANRARLRVVIRDLRKKLEPNPAKPRYLLTDSHVGYRFGPE
jgi:two-component system KDP operon response regulator KdpE